MRDHWIAGGETVVWGISYLVQDSVTNSINRRPSLSGSITRMLTGKVVIYSAGFGRGRDGRYP